MAGTGKTRMTIHALLAHVFCMLGNTHTQNMQCLLLFKSRNDYVNVLQCYVYKHIVYLAVYTRTCDHPRHFSTLSVIIVRDKLLPIYDVYTK